MKSKARISSSIQKRFKIKIRYKKGKRIVSLRGKSAGLSHRLLHKTSQNKARKGMRTLNEKLSQFVEKRITNI